MTSMRLAITARGICRVEGDELALLDLPHPDLGALLRDAGSLRAAATAKVVERSRLVDEELRCPLSRPASIWGVGLNYHAKAALTGRAVPTEPILYLKPGPAIAGPGVGIPLPGCRPAEVDYEAEVAILIGRHLRDADEAAAWTAVAGITSANDMTARDVHRATGNPALAKGFTGFSPLGPSVRDIDDLASDFDLGVQAWVNGELRQDGRTSDFIFTVPDLLARISRYTTLEPGDVVLTGTPAGTGQDRNSFLAVGDRVRVQVEGLLPLENQLVA